MERKRKAGVPARSADSRAVAKAYLEAFGSQR